MMRTGAAETSGEDPADVPLRCKVDSQDNGGELGDRYAADIVMTSVHVDAPGTGSALPVTE